MIRVFYDAGALFIDGRDDPIMAGTLAASAKGSTVSISSLHGTKPLVSCDFSLIATVAGTGFGSVGDCLAYLAGQFAMRLGTLEQAYPVAVSDGQSLIPLEQTPTDLNSVVLLVNGVQYAAPAIVASSIAVTWRGPFALSADDDVRLTYF